MGMCRGVNDKEDGDRLISVFQVFYQLQVLWKYLFNILIALNYLLDH